MISDKRITVRRALERPDAAAWAALAGASTSSLSDGQGRRGAFDCGIRPVTRATGFSGPALTVECRAGDNGAALAALDWVKSGDVVVLGNGGATVAALAGGNYVAMIRARGAVALVSDGPARDLDELDELGIPVFARGVTPAGPLKNGPGRIGFAVSIGPVAVSTGDVIVGDRDGLVCVRQEEIASAVAGYEAVRAREADMSAVVHGREMPDWLRQRLDQIGIDLVN